MLRLISLIISLMFTSQTFSYVDDDYTIKYAGNWWLNTFYGVVNPEQGSLYATYGFSVNYMVMEGQVLSLRLLRASDENDLDTSGFFCSITGSGDCKEGSISEAGVLYGLVGKNDYGHVGLTGGLAFVAGSKGPSNDRTKFSTLGIPLELQAIWTPFDYLGLGAMAIGNANLDNSYIGASLAILIGKVR